MIAYFTVEYEVLNRDQIVTFNAEIMSKKKVTNMTIDTDIKVFIPQGE